MDTGNELKESPDQGQIALKASTIKMSNALKLLEERKHAHKSPQEFSQ